MDMDDNAKEDDEALPPAIEATKVKQYVETNTSIATNIAKYEILVSESQTELNDLNKGLAEAEELVKNSGLSANSGLQETVQQFRDGTASANSTGGHSNTDHIMLVSGDYVADRIAELRRSLLNRCREALPEVRGDDRWDKQKAPGERRRRIVRSKDLPEAPPEPPPSAYIVFLGQMTTKMRHDRPNEPHRQPLIMRDISKLWTGVLNDADRKYYDDFCNQVREEYKLQHLEYRATGTYTPSERFERPDGANLWVHKIPEEKNDLELEIATYETVVFPVRPPELDADYKKREKESRERRRLKLKMEAAERRRRKNLPPIVPRKKRKKKTTSEEQEQAEHPAQSGNVSNEQEMMADDFLSGMAIMEATGEAINTETTPKADTEACSKVDTETTTDAEAVATTTNPIAPPTEAPAATETKDQDNPMTQASNITEI